MIHFLLKFAFALTILLALPVLLIRAQPYDDRATRALVSDSCIMPCFLRIRPGITTMSEAVAIVGGHEWVANGPLGFPSQIRDAALFNAVVPRTLINLRWTEDLPEWIDETQTGGLSVEDQNVLGLIIATRLSLGEIFLAFGQPDEAWFSHSDARQFTYSAWYAGQGLLISAQGICPTRRYYNFQVRVAFRPDSPDAFEAVPEQSVC